MVYRLAKGSGQLRENNLVNLFIGTKYQKSPT